MNPISFNMPSILNTPTNNIPIHFFRLPVTQQEVLLVNVLTDPVLYEVIVASPATVKIPPSNKPSSSFETTPSYDNYLLNLQSHVFPYRSPKPLTPPSQPPIPAYLSCWWTGDSTDFWGHFLETTSP